ncbi:MAG TPA: ATP-binding protein [Candidatus Binataceae bacterium]|nr:ATP-binding protein [Candidatus Binataceae bacterium]
MFAITLVSGVRAYVAGEGLYAKYQKDAVFYLRRYALGGSESDYKKFSDAIVVPLADGNARRALDKPWPDRENAARFFRAAQNAPDDIPSLVKLFLRFRHLGFVGDAIKIWGQADELTDQLADLGRKSHARIAGERMSAHERADLITRVDQINERLIVLENNFSQTLGEGSRWISNTVYKALLLADLVLLIVGFVLSALLGRSVVKEVDGISSAVGRIAQGDLSSRCAVEGSDEFVRLAEGVNQMASSIEHAQRELKHARDNALQASRVKSEFLANMSHEIRTPLNVVLGYTDVLADEVDATDNDDMKEHLDAIRRAGRRLNRTIQGILDFSKIEARAFELRPQSVKLATMLERHVEDLRILAEQKGLRIRCVIEDPKATVLFDEYCLSGALTNLLQNAIKFTEQGSVTAKLYRGGDRNLKISVTDTGIGIEPGYLTRIFEPFSQEESGYTRRFEGNGLGLALTRSYLQLNGANISVQSQKGQGSIFTITFSPESELRLNAPSVSEAKPANGNGNGVAQPPAIRRPTILVVEDDPDNQVLIRTILKKNYEVKMASSADEARKELGTAGTQIEVILMDWSLKGDEDGVTLTRNLRLDERWRKTPVVALTAHASAEDRKLAKATGFDAFLGKPVDRDELFRTLDLLVH